MSARRNVRPDEYADQAAEAIRSLNHATLGRTTFVGPSEVDAVIAHLSSTVYGMNQALEKAMRWLFAEETAGRLGHDQDADIPAAVKGASTALLVAAARLEGAVEQLDQARRVTAHLSGTPKIEGTERH